jgi:hypothetical protein
MEKARAILSGDYTGQICGKVYMSILIVSWMKIDGLVNAHDLNNGRPRT